MEIEKPAQFISDFPRNILESIILFAYYKKPISLARCAQVCVAWSEIVLKLSALLEKRTSKGLLEVRLELIKPLENNVGLSQQPLSWLENLFESMMQQKKPGAIVPELFVENPIRAGIYHYSNYFLRRKSELVDGPLLFNYFENGFATFYLFALKNVVSQLPVDLILVCLDFLLSSYALDAPYYRTIYAMLRGNNIPLIASDPHPPKNGSNAQYSTVEMILALQLYLFCETDLCNANVGEVKRMAGFENSTRQMMKVYRELRQQTRYSKLQLLELLMHLVETLNGYEIVTKCDCIFFSPAVVRIHSRSLEKGKKKYFISFSLKEICIYDSELMVIVSHPLRSLARYSLGNGFYLDFGDYGGQPYLLLEDSNTEKMRQMEKVLTETIDAVLKTLTKYAVEEEGEID
jgi:hypothetical protein